MSSTSNATRMMPKSVGREYDSTGLPIWLAAVGEHVFDILDTRKVRSFFYLGYANNKFGNGGYGWT